MNLVALLFVASVLADTPAASGPAGAKAAQDCAQWNALSQKDRLVVIGSALKQKAGEPTDSSLAACLWSIYDQIADHSFEICAQRGGRYGDAVGLAFRTAIEFCESKISSTPNKALQPTRAAEPNSQREPSGSGPRG